MPEEPDASPPHLTANEERPQRRRRWWWLAIAGVLAALGIASVVVGSPDPEARRLEGMAPPIELERLGESGTVSLAARDGSPVVVNFFASWCVPCRNELPAFAEVATRMEGRVAFIGVNTKDNRSGAEAMIEEFAVPYPTGYDPDAEVYEAYGIGASGIAAMPATVFVASDGELLEVHTGEMSKTQLEAAIERNFGLGPGTSLG